MKHTIKLQEGFCDAVFNGDKNFEIRLNDRGYQKGDIVQFIPIRKDGVEVNHEIRDRRYFITYVLGGWGLKDDVVVFGIKAVKEQNNG